MESMTHPDIIGPFVKPFASDAQDTCVTVAPTTDGGRAVRSSKNPELGTQYYDADEWAAFIQSVKAGQYDL
ncbi:DUF397 domain-containing protein [Streptacidiphilus sp. 4-A2]|nr:DUF397 domain-containing protein [Streptacidiphilus sp. 4-A2]